MKSTKKSVKSLRIFNSSPLFRAISLIFYQLVFFMAMVFNVLFYRLEVSGRRNLRIKKAFLISNHSMYLDPATVAQAVYPRKTCFGVLEETFSVPILGGMIRLLGAFPLPKRNPMKVLMNPMKNVLDKTGFIHFFPEGKLYPFNTEIQQFHEGVFFFSIHFGVPVVPLTIVARRKKVRGKCISFFPPKVRVVIGKPVYPETFMENMTIRPAMHAMADALRSRMQATIDRRLGS